MQSKYVLGGAIVVLVAALGAIWVTRATDTPTPQAAGTPAAAAPPAQAQAPQEKAPPERLPAAVAGTAEDTIRLTLAERIPSLSQIDEVRPTPVPGLYELRIGHDLLYADATGDHVFQGQLIDTRERRNLTQERIDQLTAVDFAELPLKDAIVMVNGTGKRRIAVFADPNCGFCKRFERDLLKVADVTVYTFLYPILSQDSHAKSRAVWCAAEPLKTWQAWMLEGAVPAASDEAACQTPIERNLALGQRLRVTGTPTIVFENGTRIPGALTAAQLEQNLQHHTPR